MKILHISDLHLENMYDKKNLLEKITLGNSNEKIDLCIFTGDLLNKGEFDLKKAFDILKKSLSNIISNSIYISCGNHDFNRENVSELFKNSIKSECIDIYKIDDYCKNEDDFKIATRHLIEYNNLVKEISSENDIIEKLYSIHYFTHDFKKIGIVSLNFAWTAFEENTYGKLLFPMSMFKDIEMRLGNCDFKILMSHYNHNFLYSDLQKRYSEFMLNNFDCVFYGHGHQSYTNNLVSYGCSGVYISNSASLKIMSSENYIGYNVIEINLDTYEGIENKYQLDCDNIDKVSRDFSIGTDEEKKCLIELYKKVMTKKESMYEKATETFVLSGVNSEKIKFNDMFKEPILGTRAYNNLDKTINIEDAKKIETKKIIKKYKNEIEFCYSELCTPKNYLLIGKNKFGKSTLLFRVYLDIIENYNDDCCLPIYIDLKSLYNGKNRKIDIKKLIREEYGISNTELERICKFVKGLRIKLLLDNFDYDKEALNKDILNEIEKFDLFEISCVITVDYNNRDLAEISVLDDFKKIYIYNINKSCVRKLAESWPMPKNIDKNLIIDKVLKLFKQINIDLNYYTVSLLLCVIDKTDESKLYNTFDLINLYVEQLLDKNNLTMKNEISYDTFKNYLAEIAYLIYSKSKKREGFYLSYLQLVNCFDEMKKNNIRIVSPAEPLLNYIKERDILVQSENQDLYTFRMNGLYEYFLSVYMGKNQEFADTVIGDLSIFLSFKNEIELYAGMRKDDKTLLEKIFSLIQDIKKYRIEIDEESIINEVGFDELKELMNFSSEVKNEIAPLSNEEIDEMDSTDFCFTDENGIKEKKSVELKSINNWTYMDYVYILGRVLRSLDEIQDTELLYRVFETLLKESCMQSCYFVEEFLKMLQSKDSIQIKEIKLFKEMIFSFSPYLSESCLFEMIAHPTMVNIIRNEINKLESEENKNVLINNSFKLTVLYLLLLDIDPNNNIYDMEKFVDKVKNWGIKNSICAKLIILISMGRCNENTQKIANKLINKICKKR